MNHDIDDIKRSIGHMLLCFDKLDTQDGNISMHTYGQTPDWYIEVARIICYSKDRDEVQKCYDAALERLNDWLKPSPQCATVIS